MRQGIEVHDLYVLREALGLTQEEAAHACRISRYQYGLYERGRGNPTARILRQLARGLHTSVQRLREGERR